MKNENVYICKLLQALHRKLDVVLVQTLPYNCSGTDYSFCEDSTPPPAGLFSRTNARAHLPAVTFPSAGWLVRFASIHGRVAMEQAKLTRGLAAYLPRPKTVTDPYTRARCTLPVYILPRDQLRHWFKCHWRVKGRSYHLISSRLISSDCISSDFILSALSCEATMPCLCTIRTKYGRAVLSDWSQPVQLLLGPLLTVLALPFQNISCN